MLIVYVDDIVLFWDDTAKIIQLKKKMGDEGSGNLKYFLGWSDRNKCFGMLSY